MTEKSTHAQHKMYDKLKGDTQSELGQLLKLRDITMKQLQVIIYSETNIVHITSLLKFYVFLNVALSN